MNREIMVYDDLKGKFRGLDKENYNDDTVIGTVIFNRDVLNALCKKCHVCGYVLIDEDGITYPIDIHDSIVVIFEGTYNCLPNSIKRDVIPYNIIEKPEHLWSQFFFQWQFMCDWNSFENNGSFVKLCSFVLGNSKLLSKMLDDNLNLVFPRNYGELCILVQNISRLFEIDFYNSKYIEKINYIFDALLNGYHINMSEAEVYTYCYQICDLVNKTWEE